MWFDSSNFGSWLLCYKYFPFFKKTNKKSGLTIWCLRTKYQAEYFKYKVNDRFRGPQKYLSKIFHLNSRIGRRNSIYLSREHLVELLPILLFLCWNSIRWKLVVSKSNFYLNSWYQTYFKILSSILLTSHLCRVLQSFLEILVPLILAHLRRRQAESPWVLVMCLIPFLYNCLQSSGGSAYFSVFCLCPQAGTRWLLCLSDIPVSDE